MVGLVKERKRKRQPESMSVEKEERRGSLVEDQQVQPQTRRRPQPPLQANASVIPHPCAPARHTKGHFLPLSLAKAPDPI